MEKPLKQCSTAANNVSRFFSLFQAAKQRKKPWNIGKSGETLKKREKQ